MAVMSLMNAFLVREKNKEKLEDYIFAKQHLVKAVLKKMVNYG